MEIVCSSKCQVSSAWAVYFSKVFQTSSDHCTVSTEHVETFTEDNKNHLADEVAEKIFHAHVQIVILSPNFLKWIFDHPSLVFGNLLNPEKVLGLLLGVTPSDILPEHRSSLILFSSWKLINVVENSSSFIQKVYSETQTILSRSKPARIAEKEVKMTANKGLQVRPSSFSLLRPELFLFFPKTLDEKDASNLALYLTFIDVATENGENASGGDFGKNHSLQLQEAKDYEWLNESSLALRVPAEFFERTKATSPQDVKISVHCNDASSKPDFEVSVAVQSWQETWLKDLENLCSFKDVAPTSFPGGLDIKLSSITAAIFSPLERAPEERQAEQLTLIRSRASYQGLHNLARTLEMISKGSSNGQITASHARLPKTSSHSATIEANYSIPPNSSMTSLKNLSRIRANLVQPMVTDTSVQKELALYDVPRPIFHQTKDKSHAPYIPMQPANSSSTLGKKTNVGTRSTDGLRRTCSASVVYVPPSKPENDISSSSDGKIPQGKFSSLLRY